MNTNALDLAERYDKLGLLNKNPFRKTTNMSTKETLPPMSEDAIFNRLVHISECGVEHSGVIGKAANLIDSLRTRLDAAEKELKTEKHYAQCKDETATTFMNQVKRLQAELTQLKERLSEVSKGTLMVENLRLKEANAEAKKELAGAMAVCASLSDIVTEQGKTIEWLQQANAELLKDRERLDKLQAAIFRDDPLFQFHELRCGPKFSQITLVMYNSLTTQSYTAESLRGAIDTAIDKGTQ